MLFTGDYIKIHTKWLKVKETAGVVSGKMVFNRNVNTY